MTSGKGLVGWIDRGRQPQSTKETAISKHQKDLSAELLDAAKNGDESRVRSLLAAGADPNARGADGWAPLHYAASRGSEDLVNFLIASGAEADLRSEDGLSPLHRAATRESENVVKALLAAGADPNARLENGLTPLHYATGSPLKDKNLGVVKALLAAGADPSIPDDRGRLAKDWATAECKAVLEESELLACLPPATAASKQPPL